MHIPMSDMHMHNQSEYTVIQYIHSAVALPCFVFTV